MHAALQLPRGLLPIDQDTLRSAQVSPLCTVHLVRVPPPPSPAAASASVGKGGSTSNDAVTQSLRLLFRARHAEERDPSRVRLLSVTKTGRRSAAALRSCLECRTVAPHSPDTKDGRREQALLQWGRQFRRSAQLVKLLYPSVHCPLLRGQEVYECVVRPAVSFGGYPQSHLHAAGSLLYALFEMTAQLCAPSNSAELSACVRLGDDEGDSTYAPLFTKDQLSALHPFTVRLLSLFRDAWLARRITTATHSFPCGVACALLSDSRRWLTQHTATLGPLHSPHMAAKEHSLGIQGSTTLSKGVDAVRIARRSLLLAIRSGGGLWLLASPHTLLSDEFFPYYSVSHLAKLPHRSEASRMATLAYLRAESDSKEARISRCRTLSELAESIAQRGVPLMQSQSAKATAVDRSAAISLMSEEAQTVLHLLQQSSPTEYQSILQKGAVELSIRRRSKGTAGSYPLFELTLCILTADGTTSYLTLPDLVSREPNGWDALFASADRHRRGPALDSVPLDKVHLTDVQHFVDYAKQRATSTSELVPIERPADAAVLFCVLERHPLGRSIAGCGADQLLIRGDGLLVVHRTCGGMVDWDYEPSFGPTKDDPRAKTLKQPLPLVQCPRLELPPNVAPSQFQQRQVLRMRRHYFKELQRIQQLELKEKGVVTTQDMHLHLKDCIVAEHVFRHHSQYFQLRGCGMQTIVVRSASVDAAWGLSRGQFYVKRVCGTFAPWDIKDCYVTADSDELNDPYRLLKPDEMITHMLDWARDRRRPREEDEWDDYDEIQAVDGAL